MWWPLRLSTSKNCWSRERVSGLAQHPHCRPLPHAALPALSAHHQGIRLVPNVPCPACQSCPMCPPRSGLSGVPIIQGTKPAPCACCPWLCACPKYPPPMAIRPSVCTNPPGVVPVSCAHHPWYQLPIACAIKPPSSPAGGIDPVAWGAMLEDDRLTWPPSQVGCPPLQAPPENESEVPRPAPVPCSHPVPATLVPHHLNFLPSS